MVGIKYSLMFGIMRETETNEAWAEVKWKRGAGGESGRRGRQLWRVEWVGAPRAPQCRDAGASGSRFFPFFFLSLLFSPLIFFHFYFFFLLFLLLYTDLYPNGRPWGGSRSASLRLFRLKKDGGAYCIFPFHLRVLYFFRISASFIFPLFSFLFCLHYGDVCMVLFSFHFLFFIFIFYRVPCYSDQGTWNGSLASSGMRSLLLVEVLST